MMDYSKEHDPLDSGEMGRHRLAASSPGLQERVLRAARDAWAEAADTTSPPDVAWAFPCLRLVASLAVAVILVCFANTVNTHSTARWRPFSQAASATGTYPAARNPAGGLSMLAAAAASLPDKNASKNLLRRRRQVQEILSTTGALNG